MPLPAARLPLDLLRGFVAVGRRMSITLASQDLCLSQSAVSRQIRTLEQLLGAQLLVRGHRTIAFTPAGAQLFSKANAPLQQLQEAISSGRPGEPRRPVTITCTIGIAGLWLLPRLSHFQSEHPDVDIRVAASDRVEDLSGDGIDLAIRYTTQDAVPATAERLLDEVIAPVAHPALGLEALDSAGDVAGHFLLEFDMPSFPWLQWPEWASAQGWAPLKPRGTLRFNQYDQVIRAATAGQGIALGRLRLLGPMLAAGQLRELAAPHPSTPTAYAYWLIRAKSKPRPEVLAAASWIRAQAHAE